MQNMDFVVYALKSLKTGRIYVGQTADLAVRLERHNAGAVDSTRRDRPWIAVAQERFATREETRWLEYRLKRSRGARMRWLQRNAI
jgi:putative endonuclease